MLNTAESPQIELSVQEIDILTSARKELISLLGDYKDELPEEIIDSSQPCTHKCQNNWFTMTSLMLSSLSNHLPERLKARSLNNAIRKADRFIGAYIERNSRIRRHSEIHRATEQNIKNANTVIQRVITEITSILSQE